MDLEEIEAEASGQFKKKPFRDGRAARMAFIEQSYLV
jgi:hypothetical protein